MKNPTLPLPSDAHSSEGQKSPLYLIDGYALIYRSYYGVRLTGPQGESVSALYGFFATLFSLVESRRPRCMAVLLDSKEPTFRHKLFPAYKKNRQETPEDLFPQVEIIENLLEILSIPTIRHNGYEADDLIGTLVYQAEKEGRGRPVFIVSGDKDLLQLVDETTQIVRLGQGQTEDIGPAQVEQERGVRPDQIVDYLAMVGDSSDNIPGVRGIGKVSAKKLLKQYDSLQAIYENLETIAPPRLRFLLEEGRKEGEMSRHLVELATDVPLEISSLEDLAWEFGETEVAAKLLEKKGLHRLSLKLAKLTQSTSVSKDETEQTEASMAVREGRYQAILTESELSRWLTKIAESGVVALDCETDALDPLSAQLVGISLSSEEGRACYIPLRFDGGPAPLSAATVREALEELFTKNEIKVVGQNFKYDWKVLLRWGLSLPALHFDTMVAAWMLESSELVNMDSLAARYLNYKTTKYKEVVPKGKSFDEIPLEAALPYAAEDADITLRLYKTLAPLLKKEGLQERFESLEKPLVSLLARMELSGILIDREKLREYREEWEGDLETLEAEIHRLCGRVFNIRSPKQLQEILFVERGLRPTRKTKTGLSTDTQVLMQLAKFDPVSRLIMEHRTLSKLHSTYVKALLEEIQPNGRIHTTFRQTGTATGRLSSHDPNLQNIPIREKTGRKIRLAFLAPPGALLLSADYSQIELVVLAHLSEDRALQEAFQKDQDVHLQTASAIFELPEEQVSPAQRRIAKTINFGVLYGMSEYRLSNEQKIPLERAKEFVTAYFNRYVGVRAFIEQTIEETREKGWTETLLGHRRTFSTIGSRNLRDRTAAERAAVNTRVQGSAADIVKMAMLAIDRQLRGKKLAARLLLQIHDECLFEVPEEELSFVREIVRQSMENVYPLSVPLRVNIEVARRWGEMH